MHCFTLTCRRFKLNIRSTLRWFSQLTNLASIFWLTSSPQPPPEFFFISAGLCKNHELKLKLWWVGARKRKEFIFCNIFLSRGKIFKICVLTQCIVYWINLYILLHIKKHYFNHLCCLFSKSLKAFSVSLR